MQDRRKPGVSLSRGGMWKRRIRRIRTDMARKVFSRSGAKGTAASSEVQIANAERLARTRERFAPEKLSPVIRLNRAVSRPPKRHNV